jgi:hypothetical protein
MQQRQQRQKLKQQVLPALKAAPAPAGAGGGLAAAAEAVEAPSVWRELYAVVVVTAGRPVIGVHTNATVAQVGRWLAAQRAPAGLQQLW